MTIEQKRAIAMASARARMAADQPTEAQPQAPAPAAPPESTLGDVLHAIPGGVAKGVAGLAGLPGDVNSLINSAGDWALSKLGEDPAVIKKMQDARTKGIVPRAPTSAAINKAVSDPFGGYYDPKTTAGQYSQTIASFAPNALMPGSLLAKTARMVIPGVASEAAGQATKGSKYEGLARAAGGLAGGVATGLAEGALASRAAPAPTMAELSKMKNDAYAAADQAGVVISPQSFQKFATDLGDDLTKNNVVQADIHKNALSALQVVQDEAASGVPMTLSRADAVRQAVNGAIEKAAGANGSKTDLRLAMKVKDGLDDFLDNLKPSDTLAGDPAVAVPLLKNARSLAQREFKASKIQELIDLADNSAKSNTSLSGLDQNLRTQFKNFNAQLIKDPSMAKAFTDAERDAIAKVAHGGPVRGALRLFGKLAPTNNISMGVGPSLGAAAGASLAGPVGAGVGAVAVPAMGAASRAGANAVALSQANKAGALMRAGGIPASGAPNAGTSWVLPLLLSRHATP